MRLDFAQLFQKLLVNLARLVRVLFQGLFALQNLAVHVDLFADVAVP